MRWGGGVSEMQGENAAGLMEGVLGISPAV